jgi:hypothetical protein
VPGPVNRQTIPSPVCIPENNPPPEVAMRSIVYLALQATSTNCQLNEKKGEWELFTEMSIIDNQLFARCKVSPDDGSKTLYPKDSLSLDPG